MTHKYLVWCEDDNETEDDALFIDALDFDEAAKEWARQSDREAEHRLMRFGVSLHLSIKSLATSEVQRWCVDGKPVPRYYAQRIVAQEGT